MSVITEDFRRLDGVAPFPDDLAFVYFTVPRRRENAAGTWVVVPVEVKCRLVAGKLTSPNLDPGEATVRIGPHGPTYKIIIPATDARLWDLIEMYETPDPPVVSLVKQYLEDTKEARDQALAAAEGVADIAEDAAQVAADRIAVADDRTAVAADRQASADARNGAVAAQGLAEDARDDAAETKTAVDNTKTAIDATLDAYGTQFTADKNASQQAVVDATAQANRAESEADRAEQAADDIAAGAVADGAVSTVKIQDGAVTKAKTSTGVQASLDRADTSVQEGDSRLTNARPPTAHSHTVADVTGLVDTYARLDEQRFAGMATFFHDFEGMTPGSTAPVVTDSGHTVYWDSQPPFFTGNDFTSLTPGGATYLCTEDLGATVTHVGARFKYAPNGGGDGGLCCVAITDRRWTVANIANTNMGVHFWCTPTSWALTVWVAGVGQVGVLDGNYDNNVRLTADGMTEYMMQCWISGNKATIILPDGQRRVALDDRFTSLAGNFAFFESMPNSATDDLACISAVRAGVGTTRPPWTAGSVGPKKAAAVHGHVVGDITDATTVGRNVMKAADAAAARAAIGAGTGNGTSNLALGTTSSTAMRGDGINPVASLPGSPVSGILYCIPE